MPPSEEVFEKILPQLRLIIALVEQIKNNTTPEEKADAVRYALCACLSSAGAHTGIFGWSEPNGVAKVNLYSGSYFHKVFGEQDFDRELAHIAEQLTLVVGTQKYELVEKAQNVRNKITTKL